MKVFVKWPAQAESSGKFSIKGEYLLREQGVVRHAREVERKIKVMRIGKESLTPITYPSVETGRISWSQFSEKSVGFHEVRRQAGDKSAGLLIVWHGFGILFYILPKATKWI